MPSERALQEDQNGANFSFVALSDEELRVHKEIWSKRLTIVHGFRPESRFRLNDAHFSFVVLVYSAGLCPNQLSGSTKY